jgi:hypothetical protein
MLTVADCRVGGMQVQPFSLQKQAAVRTGVANAIGVQASDVSLDMLSVFGSQVSPLVLPALRCEDAAAMPSRNPDPVTARTQPIILCPTSAIVPGMVSWLVAVH